MNQIIWKGIYNDFSDIKSIGKGYSDIQTINRLTIKAREFQSRINQIGNRDYLLPFLIALLSHSKKSLTILDFGGGLGELYLFTKQVLFRKKIHLQYYIVELPEICKKGKNIYRNKKEIHYVSKIPTGKAIDVIHIGSSLQYIHRWKNLLLKFCRLRPGAILFSDLPCGDFPTFATKQLYYQSEIPYWFFNEGDVISVLKQHRYLCVYKSNFIAKIFSNEQVLPMKNFKKRYQLDRTKNLLFLPSK